MATAKKPAAKKSEPKAAPKPEPEAKPAKKVEPTTVEKLLGLKDEIHMSAATASSDIVRTHLKNIEGSISGLQSGIAQEAAWDRAGPVRT